MDEKPNPYESPRESNSTVPTVSNPRRAVGVALVPLGVFMTTVGALNALSWEDMAPESRSRVVFSLAVGALLMIGGGCLALIRW
jgi:hypothetical protein